MTSTSIPADIITSHSTFKLRWLDRWRLLLHGTLRLRVFAETTQEVGDAKVTLSADIPGVFGEPFAGGHTGEWHSPPTNDESPGSGRGGKRG